MDSGAQLVMIKPIYEIKQTLQQELGSNIRLQWMLLAIAIILSVSLTISAFEELNELSEENRVLIALNSRLVNTVNNPPTQEQLEQVLNVKQELFAFIPAVNSANVAEASALSLIENELKGVIERSRFTLLGTEEIRVGNTIFWSVRIEVAGRVEPAQLSNLLETADAKYINRRVPALRYSPRIANTVTAVYDFLYRKES